MNNPKTKIIELASSFIKESFEELKLKLLVDDKIKINLENLILVDISIEQMDDKNYANTYDNFRHIFEVDGTKISVDVVEAFGAKETNTYHIYFDSHNGTETYDIPLATTYGLAHALSIIGYSDFFFEDETNKELNNEFQLLEEDQIAQTLLEKAKDKIPGLVDVKSYNLEKVYLVFSTGFEVLTEVTSVNLGLSQVKTKK